MVSAQPPAVACHTSVEQFSRTPVKVHCVVNSLALIEIVRPESACIEDDDLALFFSPFLPTLYLLNG